MCLNNLTNRNEEGPTLAMSNTVSKVRASSKNKTNSFGQAPSKPKNMFNDLPSLSAPHGRSCVMSLTGTSAPTQKWWRMSWCGGMSTRGCTPASHVWHWITWQSLVGHHHPLIHDCQLNHLFQLHLLMLSISSAMAASCYCMSIASSHRSPLRHFCA